MVHFRHCVKVVSVATKALINALPSLACRGFFMPIVMPLKFSNRRGSSTARGYGSQWQSARAGFLRSNPHCSEHLRRGEIVAAAVVDHIIAPRLYEAKQSGDSVALASARELFWDRKNWQSLCANCHNSWKQRLEKSGRVPGCDADGRPLDKSHHWNQRR